MFQIVVTTSESYGESDDDISVSTEDSFCDIVEIVQDKKNGQNSPRIVITTSESYGESDDDISVSTEDSFCDIVENVQDQKNGQNSPMDKVPLRIPLPEETQCNFNVVVVATENGNINDESSNSSQSEIVETNETVETIVQTDDEQGPLENKSHQKDKVRKVTKTSSLCELSLPPTTSEGVKEYVTESNQSRQKCDTKDTTNV